LGQLDLDFSADGRVAALSLSSPEEEDPSVDVVVSPTSRWKPRKLPLPRRSGYSPALSPDGQTVALSYETEQAANLWTVSTDGRGLERVASTGGVTSSAWSPDGAWIAFTDELAAREPDAAVIYLIRPDGTGLHRLTGEFADTRPAWSPDGKRLALEDLEGRVAIVALDGRGTRIVTADGHEPAWSPDGNWIAFKRLVLNKDDVYHMEVFVQPAAGGPARRIASFPGGSSSAEPLSWTPENPPESSPTNGAP
jgi:Tol biopolymer transport system component